MKPNSEFFQRDRFIHPATYTPVYMTSVLRSPRIPLWSLQTSLSEITGPILKPDEFGPLDNDLLLNYAKPACSSGRALSCTAMCATRPVSSADIIVELWRGHRRTSAQERHLFRAHRSQFRRLWPHAHERRRLLCFSHGEARRLSVPQLRQFLRRHIHFPSKVQARRLITQMYFEGDPLIPHDSILQTIADPKARDRLVARLDLNASVPLDTIAYRFEIVLRGSRQTLFENKKEGA